MADDQAKEAALQQLLAQTAPVHLISTPYSVPAGFDKAAEVKADNHNPPHTFCYNPNTDAPQDTGGGWLNSWIRVCKHTKETQGTVHVVYNRAKNAKFGDGKYNEWQNGRQKPWFIFEWHHSNRAKRCLMTRCLLRLMDADPVTTWTRIA